MASAKRLCTWLRSPGSNSPCTASWIRVERNVSGNPSLSSGSPQQGLYE